MNKFPGGKDDIEGDHGKGPGKVRDFLGKAAPPGYVAGLARGDTGFVTRPDLGPGSAISTGLRPPTGPGGVALTAARTDLVDEDDNDNENEEGLLAAKGPLASDDEEADAVFAMVEARMRERRKGKSNNNASRAPNGASNSSTAKVNNPAELFTREKNQLRQLSYSEWEGLPEAGDLTTKRAKKVNERERFTPLPDSLIMGSSIFGGGQTAIGSSVGADMLINSAEETSIKGQILGNHLGMIDNANKGSVDAAGYLKDLTMESSSTSAMDNVNDLKRARHVLRSAYQANPDNAAAWVSAARVEEAAHNRKGARLLLEQALQHCSDNVDVWLEAVRVAPSPALQFATAQRAIVAIPHSPSLWKRAAELATDPALARKLLRQGVEAVSSNASLWKALIEMEDDRESARILLIKAVECCPRDVELWIGLARVEEYSEARRVLNRARQLNPTSLDIWIAAARLEEAHNPEASTSVALIIERAVRELSALGVLPPRLQWLKQAEICAQAGDINTAANLIKYTAELGLEDVSELDRRKTWQEEAIQATSPIVNRHLLELACQRHPDEEEAWIALIDNIRQLRQDDYTAALENCPQSVTLWERYIHWLSLQKNQSQNEIVDVLRKAIQNNPESEDLQLIISKVLCSQQDYMVAIEFLQKAIQESSLRRSERIWARYCKLIYLKQSGNMSPLQEALQIFPHSEKLLLYYVRWTSQVEDWDHILSKCPQSADLHVAAADHFASQGNLMRARAILERGRKNLPATSPAAVPLWIRSIHLEAAQQARVIVNRALQIFPREGLLRWEAARLEPRPTRKAKLFEGLRQSSLENDPNLLISLAVLLEEEHHLTAAREHYQRAIVSNPNNCDAWAAWISFLQRRQRQNDQEDNEAEKFYQKCVKEIKPREGIRWKPFRKQRQWWGAEFQTIFDAFLSLQDQSKL